MMLRAMVAFYTWAYCSLENAVQDHRWSEPLVSWMLIQALTTALACIFLWPLFLGFLFTSPTLPSTFTFAPLTFVVSASALLVSAGVVDMPSLFADWSIHASQHPSPFCAWPSSNTLHRPSTCCSHLAYSCHEQSLGYYVLDPYFLMKIKILNNNKQWF